MSEIHPSDINRESVSIQRGKGGWRREKKKGLGVRDHSNGTKRRKVG